MIKLLKTSRFWRGLFGLSLLFIIVLCIITVGTEIVNSKDPVTGKAFNVFLSPVLSLAVLTFYAAAMKLFPMIWWGNVEEYRQLYRQSTFDAINNMYIVLSILLILFGVAELVVYEHRGVVSFEMIACGVIVIILMRMLYLIKKKKFLRKSIEKEFDLDKQ